MKSNSLLKTFTKFFFGLPLTILSFYFILKTIFSSKDILSYFSPPNPYSLITGILCLLIFFFLRGFVWNEILRKNGHLIPFKKSLFLISYSELRRYIPGNIFSFISRIKNYKEFNISTKILIKSILADSIILVIGASITSIPTLIYLLAKGRSLLQDGSIIYNNEFLNNTFLYILNPYVIFIFISFIILITLLIYYFVKSSILKTFNGREFTKYIDIIPYSILMWTFFGVGNFFITSSFVGVDILYFSQISSFFIFAWLIGYASFITPLGLGVRELVNTALLSLFLPLPAASSISILARIIGIIGELLSLACSYFYAKTHIKLRLKISPHFFFLLLFILLYILYFSFVSIEKHNNFFTGRFDLGNMDQTVWNTFRGRIFTLTNPDSTNIISRLGIHADFILILLAPFYFIWTDPRMLLIIQTVVLAVGAIYVYLLSQGLLKKYSNALPLVLSFSYLINPIIQKQNLYDFHAVTLSTTFLLAAYYYIYKNKVAMSLIFLLLAVLTKENVYMISALFGIFLFIKGYKKIGFFVALISISTFLLLVNKFIPEARGGVHFAVSYFSEFGDSPVVIIKNVIVNPLKTFSYFFNFSTLNYLYSLFLSTGFTSIFSPAYLLFALPDLMINILSKNENFKSINFQYAATIIPFIYISSIYGIKKILDYNIKFINGKIMVYIILIFSLYSSWLNGVLPGAKYPSLEVFREKVEERDIIQKVIQSIPRNLSVASTNNLGAHLSHRENIYTIPNGIDKADVILFLLNDIFAQPSLEQQKNIVKNLTVNPNYRLIYQIGDFYVFEKKGIKKILLF